MKISAREETITKFKGAIVYPGVKLPTFRRNLLPPASGWKIRQ
jgi:hypothetical protein